MKSSRFVEIFWKYLRYLIVFFIWTSHFCRLHSLGLITVILSLFWQEVETYFSEGLRKWRELNLTQHFGMSFRFSACLKMLKFKIHFFCMQSPVRDFLLIVFWTGHWTAIFLWHPTSNWTHFQGFSFVLWTVQFYNEVANKCQSFNQLVYNQSAIVQSLKTHLQVEGSLAYQPLLE